MNTGRAKLNAQLDDIEIRLARDEDDVIAAQNLRYQVFYKEFGAKPNEEMARLERDFDEYDTVADHLVVEDRTTGQVVGTYRLLQKHHVEKIGTFYSHDEYDLSPLLKSGTRLLELGRSCVLPEYRTRNVLQKLWKGIIEYVMHNQIETLFGCASMYGTNLKELERPLSYLYHYHLAPENFRARALDSRYVDMNILPIDQLRPREDFSDLPPLIKGYIRTGCVVGDGAVIDHQFNTTDVLITLRTHLLAERYRKHYIDKSDNAIAFPSSQKHKLFKEEDIAEEALNDIIDSKD